MAKKHTCHHHHIDPSTTSERRLWLAVFANGLLTIAQIAGGLISGSLSLIADALHNLSDAASLLIALIAIRIGRKPADQNKTFGYKRAETIAALINFTLLIVIGLYLIFEAIQRFYAPVSIDGWIVILVASVALTVDIFTAALTYSQSKNSMNMRAAFIHNLTDALASVGVIVAGILIMLYGWVWVDAALTLVIAAYVLWHGFAEIPKAIHLLMDGTPEDIDIPEVKTAIETIDGVQDVHHIHIRQINEQKTALEAHVVIDNPQNIDIIKITIKTLLHDKFDICHSTIEFENNKCQ